MDLVPYAFPNQQLVPRHPFDPWASYEHLQRAYEHARDFYEWSKTSKGIRANKKSGQKALPAPAESVVKYSGRKRAIRDPPGDQGNTVAVRKKFKRTYGGSSKHYLRNRYRRKRRYRRRK